ncbi:hypothetical protein ACFROC_00485 [Nocardia tengchongensis]|uniref:hypothetical protein n=1 Tax=Nocardia tengchongensis TaxID=2055889 RepID=UPI0036BD928F
MSELAEVTVADTVRWLHDEGLARLAGVGADAPGPIVAYTVEVATGMVTVFPAEVIGPGTDVVSVPADDLPAATGTPKRLVVVGVTVTDAVLVLDLAAVRSLGVFATRPEFVIRAWIMQLLLDPDLIITTNSDALAVEAGTRLRHTFIPGGGTLVTIDDKQPPVTTITLNPATEGPERLEVAADRSAELYLGTRFWQLHRVLGIDELTWADLVARLETN